MNIKSKRISASWRVFLTVLLSVSLLFTWYAIPTAQAAPDQVNYVVQFWSEKADYNEASTTTATKYDYLGLKPYQGEAGSTPDLSTISPAGIQFPDVPLSASSDPALFSKLFHLNKDVTKEINQDDSGAIRPLASGSSNVYNVYFDREVYQLIFESSSDRGEYYNPILEIGGTTYDPTKNPYTITARFYQSLTGWPRDKDIINYPPDSGSVGWKVNGLNSYLDSPPYRLTYEEFIQHVGITPQSVSRPGVTFTNRQISVGWKYLRTVHPVHVDFEMENLSGRGEIDYSQYYWKSDTTYSGYKFPAPIIKGFTATPPSVRQIISTRQRLEARNASRPAEHQLSFIPKIGSKRFTNNGYLKFVYTRNKYKLFLNDDPRVLKADSQYESSRIRTIPFDQPLSKLNLDKDDLPTKPSDLSDKYKFRGWSLDPNGRVYLKDIDLTMPNYNLTLYAQWSPEWDVVFDLNGGSYESSEKDITVQKFDGESVNFPTPTKDGYVLTGWKDATGKLYEPNSVLSVHSDIRLTAQWARAMATLNQAPTLVLRDAQIVQDSQFDARSLIVSANDPEDGPLANETVKLVSNGGFDAHTPGKYTFTFTVTDSAGATIKKTAVVTVAQKLATTPPPQTPQVSGETVVAEQNPPANLARTGSSVIPSLLLAMLLIAVPLCTKKIASRRRTH
ncbi:MAG: InlB B-repeat-containing protein [Arcanobacterium sp.]|nr:InlB B-repeat-containing protein [Arcanobacterium sp.]MDY5588979.1 InlB B-repeat-containing protein [Arcanobacterium sp.]